MLFAEVQEVVFDSSSYCFCF